MKKEPDEPAPSRIDYSMTKRIAILNFVSA